MRILFLLILILTLSFFSIAFCQNDWHFVDESASRLPDTISLAYDLDAGDVNGTGAISVLVGNGSFARLLGYELLFLNNGMGYFGLPDSNDFPRRNDFTPATLFFDVEGDGDLDAFVGNADYRPCYIAINENGFFNIDWTRLPIDSVFTSDADFADIDGDGDIDIGVLGNDEYANSDKMWINNGAGYFNDEIERLPPLQTNYRRILFSDFNGDLCPDILAIYHIDSPPTDVLQLFINDGTGHFTDESSQRLPSAENFIWTAASLDIDNDGDFDLILAYLNRLGIFINDGSGHFTDESSDRGPLFPQYGRAPSVISYVDADNDGDEDLLLGTNQGGSEPDMIFINDGTGHFENQTDLRWPDQSNVTNGIVGADFDGDGDADIFRVGIGQSSIFINTLNVPDSIPPDIKNRTILPQIDNQPGPYKVKLIAVDGIALPYQARASVFYSTNGNNFTDSPMPYMGAKIYRGVIPAVDSGTTVYYYYTATDNGGNESRVPRTAPDSLFSFTYIPGYVGINEGSTTLPGQLAISAYPNPFNSTTTITLSNFHSSNISIYDITGREIAILNAKGSRAVFDASSYSSGIYFAKASWGNNPSVIKLIYLK